MYGQILLACQNLYINLLIKNMKKKIATMILIVFTLMPVLAVSAATKTMPTTHRVSMYSNYFSPGTLNVKVGDKIIWTNRDNNLHTIKAMGSGISGFGSGRMKKGVTYTYTFNKAGSYEYQLDNSNIKGRINVK